MVVIRNANYNSSLEPARLWKAMHKEAFHNALVQTELRQALEDLKKTLAATRAIAAL